MKGLPQILFITLLSATSTLSQKDSDEGKPYEFGFTIDGEQHRHEKKDERGIIQGEFGFITADGIYHVTVYATDENGKFKILSMRNLRISAPLDGSPFKGEISPEANKYRKQANLAPLPAMRPQAQPNALSIPQAGPQEVVTTPRNQFVKFTTQPTIKPACAGCGYVTTKKPVPGQSPFQFQNSIFQKQEQQNKQPQQPSDLGSQNISPLSNQFEETARQNNADNQQYNQQQAGPERINFDIREIDKAPVVAQNQYLKNEEESIATNIPDVSKSPNYFEGLQDSQQSQHSPKNPGSIPQSSIPPYQSTSGVQNTNYQHSGGAEEVQFPSQGGSYQGVPEPNPLQLPGQAHTSEVSKLPPVSVSDGVIHVGGDRKQVIPIKDKFPGMQDGLPEGIDEKDITDLLYKFSYTVGFHGHYEKGLKNGAKIGGYFVNGRDGISRIVTYIADENGYRPKVRFINLGLESDETPKAETEKKFGLKSFEFIWYPI